MNTYSPFRRIVRRDCMGTVAYVFRRVSHLTAVTTEVEGGINYANSHHFSQQPPLAVLHPNSANSASSVTITTHSPDQFSSQRPHRGRDAHI